MNVSLTSVALIALTFSSGAISGDASYTCKVNHVYELADNTELNSSTFGETMIGSSFTVSRETGDVKGEVLPTFLAESKTVINRGSSQNSFKTVAFFEGQVQILEVQEYKSDPLKPFISLSMGGPGLVTGICE